MGNIIVHFGQSDFLKIISLLLCRGVDDECETEFSGLGSLSFWRQLENESQFFGLSRPRNEIFFSSGLSQQPWVAFYSIFCRTRNCRVMLKKLIAPLFLRWQLKILEPEYAVSPWWLTLLNNEKRKCPFYSNSAGLPWKISDPSERIPRYISRSLASTNLPKTSPKLSQPRLPNFVPKYHSSTDAWAIPQIKGQTRSPNVGGKFNRSADKQFYQYSKNY